MARRVHSWLFFHMLEVMRLRNSDMVNLAIHMLPTPKVSDLDVTERELDAASAYNMA